MAKIITVPLLENDLQSSRLLFPLKNKQKNGSANLFTSVNYDNVTDQIFNQYYV